MLNWTGKKNVSLLIELERAISRFRFSFLCSSILWKWVVYNAAHVGMRWKRLYVQFQLARGLTLRLLNHQHPFRINKEYHLEHRQSIGKQSPTNVFILLVRQTIFTSKPAKLSPWHTSIGIQASFRNWLKTSQLQVPRIAHEPSPSFSTIFLNKISNIS